MNFQEWFAAHKRRHPNAKINQQTRDLFWAWKANHPDPPANPTGVSVAAGSSWDVTQGNHNAPAQAAATAAGLPNPNDAQPQAQPAPAVAPPPPTFKGRKDAGQERGILNLYGQLNELPARYNIQRNRAATGIQAGLLDAGYFDQVGLSSSEAASTAQKTEFKDEQRTVTNPDGTTSNVTVRVPVQTAYGSSEAKPEGNVTYKLTYGPDGRLYRQAYVKSADAYASRGVYSSSLLKDSQSQSRQAIDTSRDQSIRNYNSTVGQIATNQGSDTTGINAQINQSNAGYTQWTGQQDAVLPSLTSPTTSSTDNSGANNVVTPSTPSTPGSTSGNLGSWTVKAAGKNANARLTQAVRKRNPGVSFKIVKRGGKYVAVRT